MMKINIKAASCRVEMDYFLKGLVLKGAVTSGCTEVRTFFRLETEESDQERLNLLIRNVKQGCFAESMIKAAVPIKSEVEVNGVPRKIEGITA
jgi:uncharacterized OsmC-like protein